MSSSLKTLEPKLSATPPVATAATGAPAVTKPVHPFALSWRFDRGRGEFVVHAGARAGALAGAALALLAGAGLAFLLGMAFRAGAGGSPAQVAGADAPMVTSEPAQAEWQSPQATPTKSKPQAKPSKTARQSKSSKQVATRGTKASGTTVAAKPRVDAQGRQAGLNYLILKSYPKQSEATSARELLARKGVAATVERNLPGWAGKGWYSLVGTTGFDMQRDRGAFDRHVKDLKALKLDPKPYRWRGAEVAAGE